MKIAAAIALANYGTEPDAGHILPDPLDRGVAGVVGKAVADASK